ncbi:MAG: SGNH/GDSL hydrolase family protein [Anaerolineales bacterium]|nr:SGNH/GDSL hydrolase family protein [Anaerolineales bacterium]
MSRRLSIPSCVVFLFLAGTACAPAPAPQALTTEAPAVSPVPARAPSDTPPPSPTVPPSATPSPAFSPPEYPHITLPRLGRLREIFQTGQGSGKRSAVFSKVGDSITDNNLFLAPFGAGDYSLGEHGYLQEAIGFFSRENARDGNSFVNDSLAAREGWRAEHVLSPAKAQAPCPAGESPLACEYRIVRPAIAVILLGTNDVMAGTPDFPDSMQTVILQSLESGVIPILTTLPAMIGKDSEPFNVAIRELALVWEIPLIDLSAALAALPNRGLGPDGVHLSWVEPAVFEPPFLKHGMTVRNLLTLQALDAVWRSYPLAASG